MRRSSLFAGLAACAAAPLLWIAPASADPGYPPTGPTGSGGGGVTTTQGGGSITTGLPKTGRDLQTAGLVGGGSVLAGVALLLAVGRSRGRRTRQPQL